jgi:very-short-patch-repair endonuclease
VRGSSTLNAEHERRSMRTTQPWRTNRARILRDASTAAEDKLWDALRNRQLGGLKFGRQMAIGTYFVDFVCRELKLVVEVDGATHSTAAEAGYDEARTRFLEANGYHVFRAHNAEIFDNLDGVLETLVEVARGLQR